MYEQNSRRTAEWALRGCQIRADGGRGHHVATYQTNRRDGQLLAAAPALLRMLYAACESLDGAERCARTHATADAIRDELRLLGLPAEED